MAIQKSKTLANGASGNYWRFMDIAIDRQNGKAVARIALFKDAATSMAGAPPLGAMKSFKFDFSIAEATAAANIVAYAYGKIRAIAETTSSYDLSGNHLDTPAVFDADLAGGTMV